MVALHRRLWRLFMARARSSAGRAPRAGSFASFRPQHHDDPRACYLQDLFTDEAARGERRQGIDRGGLRQGEGRRLAARLPANARNQPDRDEALRQRRGRSSFVISAGRVSDVPDQAMSVLNSSTAALRALVTLRASWPPASPWRPRSRLRPAFRLRRIATVFPIPAMVIALLLGIALQRARVPAGVRAGPHLVRQEAPAHRHRPARHPHRARRHHRSRPRRRAPGGCRHGADRCGRVLAGALLPARPRLRRARGRRDRRVRRLGDARHRDGRAELPAEGRRRAFTVVAANAVSTIVMVALSAALRCCSASTRRRPAIMLGATIHDMAQVVGAGYAVSEPVGNTAVIVKLFRVFLLLPMVLAIGWWFMRQRGASRRGQGAGAGLRARVPRALPRQQHRCRSCPASRRSTARSRPRSSRPPTGGC